MQATIWLANWEAEAWYDNGCIEKKRGKEKEKIMNKREPVTKILNPQNNGNNGKTKILVFAKPHNTEQPLVSGMPWLAVLCPLLAGNVISEIQGYVCSGDNLSAESGDQKMVTEQEKPL